MKERLGQTFFAAFESGKFDVGQLNCDAGERGGFATACERRDLSDSLIFYYCQLKKKNHWKDGVE